MQIKSRLAYSKLIMEFICIIVFIIVLRLFVFEIYKIPTSSMSPTLEPGDIIMVNKLNYGPRVVKLYKLFIEKKLEYNWYKGFGKPHKGDVFVFNWPRYKEFSDSSESVYGDFVVKRCYGLPGDSVIIKNKGIKNKRMLYDSFIETKTELFPHDSTSRWTLDNYGPLYVPAKGHTMNVTRQTVSWYKDILRYENPSARIKDSILVIDGKTILHYTFHHNYYFMLGDNFYYSQDSRYWGFVPDGNIIGKTVMVMFSIDPYENSLKKIRWKRFFKLI